jgi:hypothetical protein
VRNLSPEDMKQVVTLIVQRLEVVVDGAVKSHVSLMLPSLVGQAVDRIIDQRMWDEVAGGAIRKVVHESKEILAAELRTVLEAKQA